MREGTTPLPRAVIFDWDNTLVDTWPVIHDAMASTLEAMGHPPWSLEETRTRVRLSLREAFPALFAERWEDARDVFYGRFREIHLEKLEALPGSEALLAAFRAQGCWLAIVSNKNGDHLRQEARHLGWNRYFDRIVGATDAPRDKPAAEPVAMALDGSGVAAGPDVWFVGDTWVDMECAHNAGCHAVLIRKNAPEPLEFKEYPPHMHFQGCDDLVKFLSAP